MNAMLTVRDLTKTYRMDDVSVHALRGVNLQVSAGEFVGLLGPSGSGKSSLLHILGAMDRPTSGSVMLNGREITALSRNEQAELRLKTIGFVFQTFNLMPTLTALGNVAMPMLVAGVGRKQREERALQLLEQVGLADRARHLPRQLSGGQRQRVAVARALANDPRIILADEPTGNLDTEAGLAVINLLAELRDAGRTVVMVTHNPELVNRTDRVLVMRDGQVVENRPVTASMSASN